MDTELDQVLTNSLHLHYNQNIMNNAVIQIRTDQELKESAQKVAEELGFSLSSLIKAFLKNVTRTKAVTFSTGEVPSAWLIEQMAQVQKDLQVGDYHKFNSETESLEFLKKKVDDRQLQ